jgi:hypothetical protein
MYGTESSPHQLSSVIPNWTKTGTFPYREIYEHEWPPYFSILVAITENNAPEFCCGCRNQETR